MRALRVWAPAAGRARARVNDRLVNMEPEGGGWWRTPADAARGGDDYGFELDGGDLLPDPRSAWQPRGVHGPSRVVDHGRFRWNDHGWQARPLASAVIYELHVRTFSAEGTFAGVIPHLSHLVETGVTHVELMPVGEFAGSRGWGYDGVDLFAPHHDYGGPEGLKHLVDACHGHGLAVLLDVVYNHLGPAGNYLSRFGPYFTPKYGTPWGEAVNLDGPGSGEVRRFLCDNALMWLRDYHIDGLRLDAIHSLFDQSAVHFLEQLALEVEELSAALGRHLVLVAESDLNDPRVVDSRERGGYGLQAQWSDDFHHALHAALTGEQGGYYAGFGRLANIAKALRRAFVYDGQYNPRRRRHHGRPVRGLSGARFVGYLQNHDQVGNRGLGERMGHLVSPGKLRIGSALVLTSPFVPMLFQGEEFGASSPFLYFTDHEEPLGRAVAEGRMREHSGNGVSAAAIPDPQAPDTFERSRLHWEELESEGGAALAEWYRELIRLRRWFPSLSDGRMDRVQTRFSEEEGWLTVRRGPVCLACNFAAEAHLIPLPWRECALVLGAGAVSLKLGAINLPAETAAVIGEARDPAVLAWLRDVRGRAESAPPAGRSPGSEAGEFPSSARETSRNRKSKASTRRRKSVPT